MRCLFHLKKRSNQGPSPAKIFKFGGSVRNPEAAHVQSGKGGRQLQRQIVAETLCFIDCMSAGFGSDSFEQNATKFSTKLAVAMLRATHAQSGQGGRELQRQIVAGTLFFIACMSVLLGSDFLKQNATKFQQS